MTHVLLNWSIPNHLWNGSHKSTGDGIIWRWCAYNDNTGEKQIDCPGGHCKIGGTVDDLYTVIAWSKDWKQIIVLKSQHLNIRDADGGMCKVSGKMVDFDGVGKTQRSITIRHHRDERVITANSEGEWYMHLVPERRLLIHLDRDMQELWAMIPSQSEVTYEELKSNFGYMVPINREHEQL